MKLYDSYGKLTEIKPSEWQMIAKKQDSLNALLDSVLNSVDKNLKTKVDVSHNSIDFYLEKSYTRSEFEGEKTHVCGVMVPINMVDGKINGAKYFSCLKENYDIGSYGTCINADRYIVQSIEDGDHFPKIDELMHHLIDKYKLNEKDNYAYDKNMYIILNEALPMDKGFLWEQYKVLKEIPGIYGCRYNDDKISFTYNDKRDSVKVLADRLSYNGNIYRNATEFFNAYKEGISFDSFMYGNDEEFKKYVADEDEWSIEKEDEEELEMA